MTTGSPLVFANVSAYPAANSPSSPMGEYFLNITSPSRSVKISRGSPSQTMLTEIEKQQVFISGILSLSNRIDA